VLAGGEAGNVVLSEGGVFAYQAGGGCPVGGFAREFGAVIGFEVNDDALGTVA